MTIAPVRSGERLDRALAATLPELSRSRLKSLIEAGMVILGTEFSTASATIRDPAFRVKPGQTFSIRIPEPEPAIPAAQSIPLTVLYEDSDIIVIDKPPGMVVHPGPGNPDRTLVNALIAHCGPSLSGIGGVRRPGIVHRIDKDTSGLLVVAKNDIAHRRLADAFHSHDIERAYLCVVWGIPLPALGSISGNIGRHPTDRKRMTVRREGGKPAATHYRTLQRLGDAFALVECRLETGRTHQIRVHMASIGHPLVGDPTYGRSRRKAAHASPDALAIARRFPRQALHAAVLGFCHPSTGARLRWESPLPEDLSNLINELK